MKAGRTSLHTRKTPISVMETCAFLQCPAHKASCMRDWLARLHSSSPTIHKSEYTLETTLSLLCKDSHQQQLHLGKLQAVVTDLTHVTLHLFSPCISSSLGIGNRSVLSVNIMLKIHQPDCKSNTACFSKVSLDCLTSSVTVIAKLRYCQRGLIDHSGYLQKE